MQERGRVTVMATQVAARHVQSKRPVGTEKPNQVEAHDKAGDQLETVYVGMLVAVALAVLALFRRRMPV